MSCCPLDSVPIDVKIDFMKIDVEGFENEVLLGAGELIKRDRPIIFVEVFEKNRNAVEKTIHHLGYVLKEKWGDNYLFLPEWASK